MANEYFQPGSVPAPNAPGSSAVMRQEFASISAGFDKLPILAGHAGEIVTVNSTGTALVTSGAVVGDYVTKDGVFTLTNKTIAWADNIWPGFGTGATKNAGTGAGEVLLLSQSNKLPALDGSLLTGVTTSQISGVTDIAHGGTGASTLGGAQAALGIDLKADANNAVLTGAPTAPTPPTGDNSARVATTYFVTETLASIGSFAPSNAAPLMNGVANAGVGALGSRDDHVHPTDTTRAPVNSPTFTGNPTAPTPAVNDNDTSIATTAFVNAEIDAERPYPNAVPLMDGVAAMGAAANVARQDHVHPTDTTRAPLNSPTFTGDPRAPTPLTSDNDTSIATTAFVQSLIAQQPPGVQVSNSNPLMNGAVAPGTGVEASRYDHVHPSDTSRVAKSGDTMTGSLTAANLSGTNTGDQTAALVPFTPAGNIAATNVQAALQEVDAEKAALSGATFTDNIEVQGITVIRRLLDTNASYLGFRNQSNTLDALVGYGAAGTGTFEVSATRAGTNLALHANAGVINFGNWTTVNHSMAGAFLHSGSANVPAYGNGYYLQPGTLNLGFPSGTGFGSGFVLFGYNGGQAGAITLNSATSVGYNTTSDYRLKDSPLPLTGSGEFIDALKPKTWLWKGDASVGVGFIAHEAQEVSPSSVTGEKDAVDADGNPVMQMMEYGSAEFIANIIAELQDLRRRVAELENK